MNKDEFYKTMEAFHKDMSNDVVSRNWRKCFVYALCSTYKDFPAADPKILEDALEEIKAKSTRLTFFDEDINTDNGKFRVFSHATAKGSLEKYRGGGKQNG